MPPKQKNRWVANTFYEPMDVYVGRPTDWKNPFTHKQSKFKDVIKVATLDEALQRYRELINSNPAFLERVKRELKGKILGCYCRPQAGFEGNVLCHAQILAAIANDIKEEEVI